MTFVHRPPKLGWVYPAKIVKKNRDTGEWGVQEILA
jgi:hypothetical protein